MLLSSSRNGYGADFASSSYSPMHQHSNNSTATSFTPAEDEQNPRISPEIEGAIDAARRGDVQFLHDWVARGGDFQAKLDNSYVSLTLLHLAACEGDEVATHTLLRAGAAVDFVENHEGYSSLMIAGRYGHVGVMRLLLGSGASINLPDTLGHTALHYCATSGQLLGAQLLLAEGADTEAVNDFNRTALDLAVSHSHVDIANAIRQKKAENGSRDDGRISAWLQAIDMPQYIDVLLGCGWDDIDFIAREGFKEEDMTQIGVMKPGHRRKLLSRYRLKEFADAKVEEKEEEEEEEEEDSGEEDSDEGSDDSDDDSDDDDSDDDDSDDDDSDEDDSDSDSDSD